MLGLAAQDGAGAALVGVVLEALAAGRDFHKVAGGDDLGVQHAWLRTAKGGIGPFTALRTFNTYFGRLSAGAAEGVADGGFDGSLRAWILGHGSCH